MSERKHTNNIPTRLSTGRAPLIAVAPTVSPTGTRQQITETVPTIRAIMSGQQPEKTRERAPANLGIKFNPALGAANLKRFHATVRALLKSNQESGELALTPGGGGDGGARKLIS